MTDKPFRSLLAILATALLCSCTPAVVPTITAPASDTRPTHPIRAPVEISSSTVERIVLLQTLSGHSGRILDVAFSAGGELVASSGEDKKIRLWDTNSGDEIHAFQMKSVDMGDIDISTAGNLLASGEAIWDLESMQEHCSLERGSQIPAFVAFSPDGSLLAFSRFDRATELLDATSGQAVHAFPKEEETRTKEIEFAADGALLAVGVYDGTVRLWDTDNGQSAGVLHYPGETDIHGIAFSPDGRYLASGGRVPAVVLWDVSSGEVVKTFRVRDCVLSVAFSPDGTLLAAAASAEKAVLLWDVESGDLLRSLPHDDQSMAIAFSPDGRLLAIGGFDSQLYLWGIPRNPQEG